MLAKPKTCRAAVRRPARLAYVTQTTLSVDDTRGDHRRRCKRDSPTSSGPRRKDICYATQNRQPAVRELAEQVDVVLVVGLRRRVGNAVAGSRVAAWNHA